MPCNVYRRMLWAAAFSLIGAFHADAVSAQASAIVQTVSIGSSARLVTAQANDIPLPAAIELIATKAGLKASYNNSQFPLSRTVTFTFSDTPVANAFETVLAGTGFAAEIKPTGNVILVRVGQAQDPEGVISGRVMSAASKAPLSGATITIDGIKASVSTDNQGRFRLAIAPGSYVLQARALGYTKANKTVAIESGKAISVDFELEASTSVLSEVVVTGTVSATERKAVVTPISVFTAKDLENRGITNMEQLLRGEIPGVIAVDMGSAGFTRSALGGPATTNVISRGASKLDWNFQGSGLKIYVDGIELSDPMFLGTIDPNTVERVEVITGPQAATIYGSGAMGGVMQVFTKKGTSSTRHDVAVNLKYGVLQSSVSNTLAPQHNHTVNYTGGTGAQLSYALNASYNYTGQWTPGVFNRRIGVSAGLTHVVGPVNVTGTYTTTMGRNGTSWGNAREYLLYSNGSMNNLYGYQLQSETVGTQSNQTLALNATFRVGNHSQHTVTLGRSGSVFDLIPQAPIYQNGSDSLYQYQNRTTQRTTGAYTVVFNTVTAGPASFDLSAGVNGSAGSNATTRGGKGAPVQSSLINMSGQLYPEDKSAGTFGSLRLGLFGSLYTTMAVRFERNNSYGDQRKTNITPSNGLAYTLEKGTVSLKLMGSYGSATRAPLLEQKLGRKTISSTYQPSEYWSILPNEFMTPEYSRGPQGGFELYVGNRGSLTVNHYQQKVTDLIASIRVDSFQATVVETGLPQKIVQSMYMNAASLRSKGWDVTAGVFVMGVRVNGTYSVNESKIISRGPNVAATQLTNVAVPTRSGNITVNYAHGGTSFTLVTNYIGQTYTSYGQERQEFAYLQNARLNMYQNRGRSASQSFMQPGYYKQNVIVSHRVLQWLDVTANIVNLTNSFAQEPVVNAWFYPTLGRTSTFGMSLRFPRSR